MQDRLQLGTQQDSESPESHPHHSWAPTQLWASWYVASPDATQLLPPGQAAAPPLLSALTYGSCQATPRLGTRSRSTPRAELYRELKRTAVDSAELSHITPGGGRRRGTGWSWSREACGLPAGPGRGAWAALLGRTGGCLLARDGMGARTAMSALVGLASGGGQGGFNWGNSGTRESLGCVLKAELGTNRCGRDGCCCTVPWGAAG